VPTIKGVAWIRLASRHRRSMDNGRVGGGNNRTLIPRSKITHLSETQCCCSESWPGAFSVNGTLTVSGTLSNGSVSIKVGEDSICVASFPNILSRSKEGPLEVSDNGTDRATFSRRNRFTPTSTDVWSWRWNKYPLRHKRNPTKRTFVSQESVDGSKSLT
jgi:hypothetical protein